MFTHEARMVRLLALVGSVTVFFDANLTLGVRSVSGWRVSARSEESHASTATRDYVLRSEDL
jgi:hypothetical protein